MSSEIILSNEALQKVLQMLKEGKPTLQIAKAMKMAKMSERKQKIKELLKEGKTYRQIATQMKCSMRWIAAIVKGGSNEETSVN